MPELQAAEYVATGPTVLEVIITGTVVVHKLSVFVKITEYVPAELATKLDVDVFVHTAIVFAPVTTLTFNVFVKQDISWSITER